MNTTETFDATTTFQTLTGYIGMLMGAALKLDEDGCSARNNGDVDYDGIHMFIYNGLEVLHLDFVTPGSEHYKDFGFVMSELRAFNKTIGVSVGDDYLRMAHSDIFSVSFGSI